MPKDTVARLVKRARERVGCTQDEVDSRLGRPGSGYTANLERGKVRLPPADVLIKLQRIIGLDPLDVLRALGYPISNGTHQNDLLNQLRTIAATPLGQSVLPQMQGLPVEVQSIIQMLVVRLLSDTLQPPGA